MSANLLVLGGSIDQLPMIKAAKSRGFYVVLMDFNAACLGRRFADQFVCSDISNEIDVENVAKEYEVKGIVSMITEAGVIPIWKANRSLQLPGMYSEFSAYSTHCKYAMRRYLSETNIPNIPFQKVTTRASLEEFANKQEFRIVLKRSKSGGQRDLMYVNSRNELDSFINQNTRITDFIAERYIEGSELNCVYTVSDGMVRDLIISDRNVEEGVFGVVKEHVFPSRYKDSVYEQVKGLCVRINELLDIRDAVVFPQFILEHDTGITWLIELGVRIPGGIMDRLFYYATGVDLVTYTLDIAVGEKTNYEGYRVGSQRDFILVSFFNGPPGPFDEGIVSEIKLSPRLMSDPNILEHGLFGNSFPNVRINRLAEGGSRFYYCVTTGDYSHEAQKAANRFYDGMDVFDQFGYSLKNKARLV